MVRHVEESRVCALCFHTDRCSAMSRDAKVVSAWDFDRLIPCHGEVLETGGKALWNKHFEWYLDHSHTT
jgi:hypothetical protein